MNFPDTLYVLLRLVSTGSTLDTLLRFLMLWIDSLGFHVLAKWMDRQSGTYLCACGGDRREKEENGVRGYRMQWMENGHACL